MVRSWKKITDAIRGKGAKIDAYRTHRSSKQFAQGASLVGPSTIVAAGHMYTDAEARSRIRRRKP
jgi:hypothetical protein